MRKFKRRFTAGLMAALLSLSLLSPPNISATQVDTGTTEEIMIEGEETEISSETEITSEDPTEEVSDTQTDTTSEVISSEENMQDTTSEEEGIGTKTDTTEETTAEEPTTEEESEIISGEDDNGVKVYFDENGEIVVDIPEEAIKGMLDAYGADDTLATKYDWKRLKAPHDNREGKGVFNALRSPEKYGIPLHMCNSIISVAYMQRYAIPCCIFCGTTINITDKHNVVG